MVRRRGIVGGLAKQLSYSAYQHMMAPPPPGQHLNIGWLGSPSVHWPPQAPRPPSLMSVMCNKMVGSLPRMPSLPQPELSSRRLSRLRRNLMQSPHPQVLPAYPPAPLVQTANILPMWCRSDEQMWCDPVKQRHRLPTSDISIQLKQQLQQLKRQQQLQQQRQRQQQQQQQQQQQRQLRSGFMPFNFGKCASSLIKFLDRSGSTSESSLYAATHPNPVPEVQPVPTISIVKRPYSVERHIHAADFDYVKLAKQMVTSKDKQFTGCGVGRTQVLPTHGEPHRLANRGSSKAPVSFTADYSASSTTLTNHSAAQAGRQEELKAKSQSLQGETPAEMQLNYLAADIDANLQHIRKLLGTKLPHKRCGSSRTAKGLATLQRPEMCAKLKFPPLAGHAARLASLAAPQQSETRLPQRVHQQHGSSIMSASLAALQQSELPQQLEAGFDAVQQGNPTRVASLSEMKQSELSDNVELPQQMDVSGNVTPTTLPNLTTDNAGAKQEFKFTTAQLELVQKILQEKDQLQRATEPEPEPEATMKAKTPKSEAHKRQINLNELFKDKNVQCVESDNSLWNSLMQLVAHMCDDGKRNEEPERLMAGASLKPSKKEYSIYLMVTSDEEDDVGDSSRVGNQRNTPIASRKPRQTRLRRRSTIKPLDIPAPHATLRQQKQQDQLRPLRKKRRLSLGHQNTEVFSCLSLPARRPLHWPNPRHIKCLAQGKKKRKRLPRRPCLRRQASNTLDSSYQSQLINLKKNNNRMSNPFLPQPRVPVNYTGFW